MELLVGIQVTVSESDMLQRIGYTRRGMPPTAKMSRVISEVVKEGTNLIKPQTIYDKWDAALTKEAEVVLSNGKVLKNPRSGADWAGLEQVIVAICTIGPLLEERVSQLSAQGNVAKSILLDDIGTAAVRDLTRKIDALFCQQAIEKGMKAGMRFSPGSTGWDIADQRAIFELLPAEMVGVSLNDQLLMIPRKSLSFVVAIGETVPVPKSRIMCQYCDKVSCPDRQIQQSN